MLLFVTLSRKKDEDKISQLLALIKTSTKEMDLTRAFMVIVLCS